MKDLLEPDMIIYDFDPRKLPPDLQRALGLVVAAASHTEGALQQMIAAVLRTDMISANALSAQMSTPQKLDVIRSLVELYAASVDVVDDVDDIIDAIRDAVEKRNGLAHCLFGIHPETKEVIKFKATARGSVVIRVDKVAIHEIEDIGHEIYWSGIKLVELMGKLNAAPSAPRPMRQKLARSRAARDRRRAERPRV